MPFSDRKISGPNAFNLLGLALALALMLALLPPFSGPSLAKDKKDKPITDLVKPSLKAPRRYLPQAPTNMTLCGQPVPLNLAFVAEQFDREFTIMVNDQAQVVMWLKRAARYFPYIEKRLKKAGLPDDLKYLAVAESSLIYKVRSPAGAVGIWQFIPATGRRYGLRKDRYFDDRRNVEKATNAALAYLKDLYSEFKSWPLAMAAYNCGERRVRKEISEQGVDDYYHLYLPNETMRYVYRILAAKAVITRPEAYGYHLPKTRLYHPRQADRLGLSLKRPLHLRILAKSAGTTLRRIKELNPELRGYYLPRGKQEIKLPPGAAKGVAARLKKKGPGPQPQRHASYTVRPGDTLTSIARKNNVKLKNLRKANRITGSAIKPGQKLVIPGG